MLGLGGRSACDELTYTKWIVELIISLILLLHRSITVCQVVIMLLIIQFGYLLTDFKLNFMRIRG